MTADQRRYVAAETAISVSINAAFSALIAWLVFGGRSDIPLTGADGVLIDFVPQTFMIALMSVLVPTMLTRSRIRDGRVDAVSGRGIRLPRNVLLRALLMAVAATVVIGGLAALALNALHSPTITFSSLLTLKVLYGAAVALIMTPVAVSQALIDAIA